MLDLDFNRHRNSVILQQRVDFAVGGNYDLRISAVILFGLVKGHHGEEARWMALKLTPQIR